MPGKVNPSIPEMVNQVCYQVMGCDATVARGGGSGSARTERDDAGDRVERAPRRADPARGDARARTSAASAGIKADEARARELLDRSTAAATALSPYIGYAATADIAKTAVATGRSLRDLVLERGLLPPDQLDRILSVESMTQPGRVPGARLKDEAMCGSNGRRPRRGWRWRCAGGRAACSLGMPALRGRSSAAPAASPALPAGESWRAGSRPTATCGRIPIRSWTRCGSPTAASSPTWARAAAGSRCVSRAASGPNGMVYAEDIQQQMLEAIDRRVKREGLSNVRTVLGTPTIRSFRRTRSTRC